MNLTEKFKALPKVKRLHSLTPEDKERVSDLRLTTLESLMVLKEILGPEEFALSSLTRKVEFVKELRSARLLKNLKG